MSSDHFHEAAAQLRADSRDVPAFVNALAVLLEQTVPDLVEVERRRARFLSAERVVSGLRCTVGERVYALVRERGGLVTTRARAVRGITIKTEALPVDAWVADLVTDLREQAGVSAAAYEALRGLVT